MFTRSLLLFYLIQMMSVSAADTPLPKVKVENIRQAFHNGEHNAFTDLISWKGEIWLTFRSCPYGIPLLTDHRIEKRRRPNLAESPRVFRAPQGHA